MHMQQTHTHLHTHMNTHALTLSSNAMSTCTFPNVRLARKLTINTNYRLVSLSSLTRTRLLSTTRLYHLCYATDLELFSHRRQDKV